MGILNRLFQHMGLKRRSNDPIEINSFIQEVISGMKPGEDEQHLGIELKLVENLPGLDVNRAFLADAISNLIRHSAQETKKKSDAKLTIRTGMEDDDLFIEFHHNGGGMPLEKLSDFFDPLSPLGIYGLVKDLKAQLFLDSKEGEGAFITIIFPDIKNH